MHYFWSIKFEDNKEATRICKPKDIQWKLAKKQAKGQTMINKTQHIT